MSQVTFSLSKYLKGTLHDFQIFYFLFQLIFHIVSFNLVPSAFTMVRLCFSIPEEFEENTPFILLGVTSGVFLENHF